MYKITVSKNGIVQAVYFNENKERGLSNARMMHSSKCKFKAERV